MIIKIFNFCFSTIYIAFLVLVGGGFIVLIIEHLMSKFNNYYYDTCGCNNEKCTLNDECGRYLKRDKCNTKVKLKCNKFTEIYYIAEQKMKQYKRWRKNV
jgi:hypothetical protein